MEGGSAHCVLVLEKDSFFQHLMQGKLLDTLPLILVTGGCSSGSSGQRLVFHRFTSVTTTLTGPVFSSSMWPAVRHCGGSACTRLMLMIFRLRSHCH
mmetsp:Transcript_13702/g.30171  ORF Transcript_13702/g.30171 Transcript_13702/m.30171 type:complete len:97 (-) Transcript_13702:28-318(-)